MKVRIAMFTDPKCNGFQMIHLESSAKYTEFLRVTDWVDVELPPRSDAAEIIQEEANKIDAEMERVVQDNMNKLKALKARKTAVLSRVFDTEFVA